MYIYVLMVDPAHTYKIPTASMTFGFTDSKRDTTPVAIVKHILALNSLLSNIHKINFLAINFHSLIGVFLDIVQIISESVQVSITLFCNSSNMMLHLHSFPQ